MLRPLIILVLISLILLQPVAANAGTPKKRPRTPAAKPTPTIVPGKPVDLTASEQAAVRAGVQGSLKDPESARFGPMAAIEDEQKVTFVCGFVNAENSFGGYTGMQPFNGILTHGAAQGTFVPVGIGGDEYHLAGILGVCKLHGVAGF